MEMNWARPLANSQQRIENLKVHKELNPDNQVSKLESESFCSLTEPSDETTALHNTLQPVTDLMADAPT